jgi:hypothetical protein
MRGKYCVSSRGVFLEKVIVTQTSFLSFSTVYLNFMADPNQQLPPGWIAEWQVTLSSFKHIFLSNHSREPDNQRYLFVGASSLLVLLTIVRAVMTLQRLPLVVLSGNIPGQVPYLSQQLPQPPFHQHCLRNPRNAVSTPSAKRKPTTEVLTQLWPPHMVALERSLPL